MKSEKKMKIQEIIRYIQITAVSVIFLGSFIGFSMEVFKMISEMQVDLADLLLLFIYVEVMGMTRVYLLSEEIRITYPLIISITAISRLIILQKKELDPSILVYESIAILIIAFAIIVLRLRYLKVLEPKKNQK
tara:strand:+ start:470 stop:871 length:402 start_codon:yes stop_codon:yes gene_type:complete